MTFQIPPKKAVAKLVVFSIVREFARRADFIISVAIEVGPILRLFT